MRAENTTVEQSRAFCPTKPSSLTSSTSTPIQHDPFSEESFNSGPHSGRGCCRFGSVVRHNHRKIQNGLNCKLEDSGIDTYTSEGIIAASMETKSMGSMPLCDGLVEDGLVPQPDTRKDDASGIAIAGERQERTYANAFAKVGPAVVHIHAPTRGNCSGTIIDKDGTVLTCTHAFVDLGRFGDSYEGKVYITLQDGRTFEGTVVNLDVHSDIAIIKLEANTPLPSAELGHSSRVQPGECVIAIGSPYSFKNTVTAGIVSCAARKNSDMRPDGWREYREYIQTDCATNPGNSGGPLVNMDGEVIGVNILMVRSAVGLNFAVPIDSVTKIMDQFKKNGRVVQPWLGVKMIDLNDKIISQLEERGSAFANVKKGILVPMVTPGSPGERAGFRPGDVVSEFDGKTVETVSEIIEIVGDRVGEPLKVVVKRVNDEKVTLTVILEESSDPDM